MDFLLNSSLIKYEIFFILASLVYIIFHIIHSIIFFFLNLGKRKNIEEKIVNEAMPVSVIIENHANETKVGVEEILEDKNNEELSNKEKDKLLNVVKIAKTKFSLGDIEGTKASIIEGLSINKDNRELNMLLAIIYENEHNYKKAELIYKDLVIIYDHDLEIHKKLGFVLSLQGRYELAYKIYKKSFSINENDQEVIEMVANLAYHIGEYTDAKIFAKLFLKNKPRNLEVLTVLAYSHINLTERIEALEILKKVKELDPYNSEIDNIIEKLKTEMELQHNFVINKKEEKREES
ncbi:MAG: hypothetical protein PHF46_01725 [Candidatus Gracilibacteria bacterium]|nr:hypothetical protein [Candidatus Gracilibacteria bacterium]MDD3120108.1 hypothetical protein [Candidatus Gracilibacteria bacterium]